MAKKKKKAAEVLKEEVKTETPAPASEKVEVEDLPEIPTDPFDQAVAAKNRGNKYFRGGRYELAVKCYAEAIEKCPEDKTIDLATFYQNRAAAHDQLDDLEAVIADCDVAVKLNNKYVKALDRRARTMRKQAMKDLAKDIKESRSIEDVMVVSPDVGGVVDRKSVV